MIYEINKCLFTGNQGYLGFDFTNFTTQEAVTGALNRTLRFRGENTNTTGGMRLARERLFNTSYGMRPDVKHVMLLVTDGVPTFDADKLQEEIDIIKNLNIRIMAVGVTNQVSLISFGQISPQALNLSLNLFIVLSWV